MEPVNYVAGVFGLYHVYTVGLYTAKEIYNSFILYAVRCLSVLFFSYICVPRKCLSVTQLHEPQPPFFTVLFSFKNRTYSFLLLLKLLFTLR
jgi:hypothetical protein